MATILGFSGVEKIAPGLDEVHAGDASLLWFMLGDSNLGKDGHGYAWARRLNLASLLNLPVLATYTTCLGIYSVSGSIGFMGNGVSDIYPSTLNGDGGQFDQDQEADYSLLSSLLHPFMPIGAAMRAVDQFQPGVPESGNTLDAPRYVIAHEATANGHNFSEDYRVYMAHPIQSTFGSHAWQVRAQTGGTNIANGTVDHSPAGAPADPAAASVEIRLLATVTSDFPGGAGNIQLLPFEVLETPTGINCVLSMFAAWPNRPHGYLVAPMIFDGGGSLADYKAALDAAPAMWTKWKFQAACAAMLGRRTHAVIEIQHGLNDTADEGAFLTNLTSVVNDLLEIWDAGVADGSIPSNIASVTVLYAGCPHRINLTGKVGMTYAHNAARTLEPTVSRFCCADFQDAMTDGETDLVSTDGSHINLTAGATQAANYLAIDKRWCSRFFTACRLASGLRRIAV